MNRLAPLGRILIPALFLVSASVHADPVSGAASDGIRVRIKEIDQRVASLKPLKKDAERKLAAIGNGTLDRTRYNDSRCDIPCNPLLGASSCRARDLKAADVQATAHTCAEIFKSDPELTLVSLDCARAVRKCGTVAKKLDTEALKLAITEMAREYRELEAERNELARSLAAASKKPVAQKEAPTDRNEKPQTPAPPSVPAPYTIINAEPARD